MKFFKIIAALFICAYVNQVNAQISSYEEIEFETDSMKMAYKPLSKKPYVFLKSKKSAGGMPRTAEADAILNTPVTDIILVFSETSSEDLAEREEANRARWENLLETYPEFFQYNSVFKNVCQCNNAGDAEAFKAKQGFYVYYEGAAPAPEPVVQAEPVKPAATPAKETARPAETPVKESTKTEAPATPQTKAPAVTETKAPEKKAEPAVTKVAEPVIEKEIEKEAVEETEKPEPVAAKPARVAKAGATPKRPGYEKPRRSKDTKACRQPCYGYGDDDLVAYFKNSVMLTKKQKKKGKNILIQVRIQLNYDGSIKKAFVQGENEVLNQQVQAAIDQMGYWNPCVKAGVTVKSEVKFVLKYDKPSKTLRPSEFMLNPRQGTKCPCVSDSELFGD